MGSVKRAERAGIPKEHLSEQTGPVVALGRGGIQQESMA